MNNKKNYLYTVNTIFILSILYLVLINILNIDNPIIDRNGFRQTQTAITSYYLFTDGISFKYMTPILGQPWSVPFEFPLYQFIVSSVSFIFGLSLDVSGKLVSLFFSLLTIFIASKVFNELNISKNSSKIILSIFITMPTITFWSGTFMIESTALFFTLSSIYFLIISMSNNKNYMVNILCYSFFLTFALLQKSTTVLFPYFLIFLFFIYKIFKYKESIFQKSYIILGITSFIPLVILIIWTQFTDDIKALGTISQYLTSSNLNDWNFGRFQDVFSLNYFFSIFLRASSMNSGVFIGAALILYHLFSSSKKENFNIILCLVLFFGPMLIFKPLHMVHDYYQYANLIFLATAIGLSLSHLEKNNRTKISSIILIGIICVNVSMFSLFYGPQKFSSLSEENSFKLNIATEIKDNTLKEDRILILGLDWSSEIPYYAERKAVMLPEWFPKRINKNDGNIFEHVLSFKNDYIEGDFKMIILCNKFNKKNYIVKAEDFKRHKEINECSLLKKSI